MVIKAASSNRLDEVVENLVQLRWRVVHLPFRRRCIQFQVFQLRCEVCQDNGDAEFGMLGEMLAEPRVRRRQQIRVVDVETDDDHASQLKRFFSNLSFNGFCLISSLSSATSCFSSSNCAMMLAAAMLLAATTVLAALMVAVLRWIVDVSDVKNKCAFL